MLNPNRAVPNPALADRQLPGGGLGSPRIDDDSVGHLGETRTDYWMDQFTEQDFLPALKKGEIQALSRPSLSYWQDAWIRLKANRQAYVSLILIVFLTLFTTIGPFLWNIDPAEQELTRVSERPGLSRTAQVLPELPPFEEKLAAGVEESPIADGATLRAPASLQVFGEATPEAVRLVWDPVPGAAGYRVYRGLSAPIHGGDLGVPVGEVEGGNRISYEDKFNLTPGEFHYAVTAKNGDESPEFATVQVKIAAGIPLPDAQVLNPDVKPGGTVRLKAHPLGTDYMGRDLLSRLMQGGRISLFIGLVAPLFATLLGVLIGGIAGFFSGRMDEWLMRFTDFVLALPFLLFMILFKVTFGSGAGESGITAMLVAMITLSWTGPARLTRGQVLQLRESEFVQAARLMGGRPAYIILRHLLPNTLGVILVSLTFSIPTAIFTEAFLSFIGMGVVPPTPSWGAMCNDGIQTFLTHPHEFLFPAAMISIAVLAFNLMGDGLRDALDPKMRSR